MKEKFHGHSVEQKRISWKRFSLAAVVVVVLFVGIKCLHLWPKKLHPIQRQAKLRKPPSQGVASSPAVQGAPIGAPIGPVSESESPVSELSVAAAEVGASNVFEKIGEYTRIPFEFLTNYVIDEPDWSQMDDAQYVSSINLDTQIPERVKRLNGKKVAIQGFMLPIDFEAGKISSFFLLKDQMMCCFGVIPRINDWVYVKVDATKNIEDYPDRPITIMGTLRVGQEFEKGIILGVYHMTVDEVRKSN